MRSGPWSAENAHELTEWWCLWMEPAARPSPLPRWVRARQGRSVTRAAQADRGAGRCGRQGAGARPGSARGERASAGASGQLAAAGSRRLLGQRAPAPVGGAGVGRCPSGRGHRLPRGCRRRIPARDLGGAAAHDHRAHPGDRAPPCRRHPMGARPDTATVAEPRIPTTRRCGGHGPRSVLRSRPPARPAGGAGRGRRAAAPHDRPEAGGGAEAAGAAPTTSRAARGARRGGRGRPQPSRAEVPARCRAGARASQRPPPGRAAPLGGRRAVCGAAAAGRARRQGRSGRSGAFRDMRRDNRATVDSLATLRYGYADVSGDPCGVAEQVAAVLQLRGWPGALLPCPDCLPGV